MARYYLQGKEVNPGTVQKLKKRQLDVCLKTGPNRGLAVMDTIDWSRIETDRLVAQVLAWMRLEWKDVFVRTYRENGQDFAAFYRLVPNPDKAQLSLFDDQLQPITGG